MTDITKIQEEYIKCYSDKSRIYMIENYLKTYDATQRKNVRYELFPRQKDFCNKLSTGHNIVVVKSRQSGFTTTASAYLACELALADPASPITVLAIGNTLDIAQQFVTKIRDFVSQLPRWFFGPDYWSPDEKDPRNKLKITVVSNTKELKLFNDSKVVARSSGEDASRGVGGVTYCVFDEAAFIEKGNDVYASAVATVSTGGQILMISTPNGKDQLYYKTVKNSSWGSNTNGYIACTAYWFQDPRYNKHLEWVKKQKGGDIEILPEPVIDADGNIAYDEEHWKDMMSKGYKPRSPWYVRMCKNFNNDPQKIAQELDISFLGSDSTVVAPEFIEMQENLNVKDPDPSLKDGVLSEMWIWKPPYAGHRYIIGVDNSKGDSDDATALEIIDIDGIGDDGLPCIEQVAEYNGKLTGDSIGEIAYSYGLLYNEAFIVVEDIGGYGSASLLTLMNLGYKNLYYDDPSLKNYTAINDATPLQVTKDGLPGFHSSSVRFQMLAHFANLVRTNQYKIRSKRVINELETWIFKNGRIDHKDGCHDDTLTCTAMALFVLEYSINRQVKAKNKDKVMLKTMIAINNPNKEYTQPKIDPTEGFKKKEMKKNYLKPLYTNRNLNSKKYASVMWLIK